MFRPRNELSTCGKVLEVFSGERDGTIFEVCDPAITNNDNGFMLLEELRALETEMHVTETRRNRHRMEALLHPEFVEFGRSGTRYSRADILNEFGPNSGLPAIHSENFNVTVLAEGVALLTYLSAHVDARGKLHKCTLRSSVWVRTDAGWQMRFHQGTPAECPSSEQESGQSFAV